jgi:hypothetical protein
MELYRWIACLHCGEMVRVNRRAKWASCEACKAELKREADRNRYIRRGRADFDERRRPVVVVRDALPVEEGGFRHGAIFTMDEYKKMLKYLTIVPGTELLVEDRRVTVVRVENRLVEVGG